MQIDSAMVKLADQCANQTARISSTAMRGYELVPNWMERMAEKSGRGWQMSIEPHLKRLTSCARDMAQVGQIFGLDIS